MKTNLYVEYAGSKTDTQRLVEMTKDIWKAEGNKLKDIESMDVYFKPEENMCYYVVNDTISGSFGL